MTDDRPTPEAPRPTHPIVRLDYLPRIVGHLLYTAILASILRERGGSRALWGAVLALGLLWPHLAYLHAGGTSGNSKKAELTNLRIDAFVSGCWIALAHFSPWPMLTFVTSVSMATLSAAGVRFTLGALSAMALGSGVMGALAGFRFRPDANPLTTGICFGGMLLCTSVFGLTNHRQARLLIRRRRTIQAQARELGEALEQSTATGGILRAMSSSPTQVQQVLDVVARDAARLCDADDALIFRLEGEALRAAAAYGTLPRQAFGEDTVPVSRGSVTGRSVVERRAVHVHDLAAEPHAEFPEAENHQERLGLHTVLAAPLLRENVPVGAILLRRTETRPFSERQVERLKTFADQAAVAIENARLFEALRARTGELARSLEEVRALGEVTRTIGSSLDLHRVLDSVIRDAVTLSGSDAGVIVELMPPTRVVDVASHDLGEAFLDALRKTPLGPAPGLLGRIAEGGHPFQVPDLEEAHGVLPREITRREGLRALLAVPIPGENLTRGIVVFRRAAGPFDERLVQLLVALANQSKVAIDNAHLFAEVQSQQERLEQLSKNQEQLYRLSTAMQEPLSLREQLHRVLEAASQMGILDRIYVWAVSPEADRLVNLAGAGFSADEWKDFDGTEIPLVEAGAMYKAYQEGVPLLFNESSPLPRELALRPPYSELRAIRTRNFLVVPMIAKGVTVGVLAGDNKPSGRPIAPPTVDLLQAFASHAAVAIANARLFQAIEDKSRQIEAANRAKSQFLANMSHELCTPMNAILGYTELILDDTYGEVPEKIRAILERVDKSGRHLLGLINDVLDLSKIEAGRLSLDMSEYSLKEIVQNVFMAVEALAADKRLHLTVTVPPDLPPGRGDARRLTQVLLNLVGNAIKFTEAGEVAIRAMVAGDSFVVSVSDTGPGIAPENQRRIFEFQQIDDSDTRRKGGSGLGLAIARRLIEMHDGRLWVESTPGQGSTFSFTVPCRLERRRGTVPVVADRRAPA